MRTKRWQPQAAPAIHTQQQPAPRRPPSQWVSASVRAARAMGVPLQFARPCLVRELENQWWEVYLRIPTGAVSYEQARFSMVLHPTRYPSEYSTHSRMWSDYGTASTFRDLGFEASELQALYGQTFDWAVDCALTPNVFTDALDVPELSWQNLTAPRPARFASMMNWQLRRNGQLVTLPVQTTRDQEPSRVSLLSQVWFPTALSVLVA